MELLTHPHLVPRLRLRGAIPPLPLYACMACMRTTSPLLFPVCKIVTVTAVCARSAVRFLYVMQTLIHGLFFIQSAHLNFLISVRHRWRRWVDNIRMDLQEVGCGYVDWIGLAQDRYRWRTVVSAVMNLQVP